MTSTTGERLPGSSRCLRSSVFAGAAFVLYRVLAHIRIREVVASFRAIPARLIGLALLLTCVSYWLLGFYDVLALRYARKQVAYTRALFTAFIAYAFGHNFTLAGVTGAAVRLRLYSARGLTAIDVATVSGFCSLTSMLGLGALAGVSLLLEPNATAVALHFRHTEALLIGAVLVLVVLSYLYWASFVRTPLEIRGWALRPPGALIGLAQPLLGALDFAVAGAVVWVLLPPSAHIGYFAFAGLYAAAITVGLLSHVPGGLGVFEAMLLLMLPEVPTEELLGSLLAFRAVYYLAPLVVGGARVPHRGAARTELALGARASGRVGVHRARRAAGRCDAHVHRRGACCSSPARRPASTRASTSSIGCCRSRFSRSRTSSAASSGSGCWCSRVAVPARAAPRITSLSALLAAGIVASLAQGHRLRGGRAARDRPGRARARPQRVLPADVDPCRALHAGLGREHRRRHRCDRLDRLLRVSPRRVLERAVVDVRVQRRCAAHAARRAGRGVVLAAAYCCCNLLRPARPEPAVAGPDDLGSARGAVEQLGAVASRTRRSTGDKRLLFSDDRRRVRDVSGLRAQLDRARRPGRAELRCSEELVWRFRELSDRHGGLDRVLSGEPRRGCRCTSTSGSPRSRSARKRACRSQSSRSRAARARSCVRTTVARSATARRSRSCRAERVPRLLPELRKISDAWLAEQGHRARSASRSARSIAALSAAVSDVALVRAMGALVAFANLWPTRHEARAVGRPDALRSGRAARRDGLPVRRADAVGPRAGLPLVQPRHGAARRASSTIRSRRRGTASATSCSATASTSTTSRACAATRRSFGRSGSRAISSVPAASHCRGSCSTCRR